MSLSFKNVSLRVRIFVADSGGGADYLKATTSIPLPQLQMNMPKYVGTGTSDPSRDWVNENPLVTGDVVAWCELGTARTSRPNLNPDSLAVDQEVHFGDVWSGSTSLPGLKLRARIKRPRKKSKSARNHSVQLSGSFVSSPEASPKSPMPMQQEMQQINKSGSFLGTKAGGRSVANKSTVKKSSSSNSLLLMLENDGDY